LARIKLCEPGECFVESEQDAGLLVGGDRHTRIERNPVQFTAAFGPIAAARMVHQNLPHRPGRATQKVPMVLPVDLLVGEES